MAFVAVPSIYERDRIPQEAIASVVRQIIAMFRPQKIILFGSYAYGQPQPESDVDILVVMETDLKESKQALQIYRSLERDLFGLDILVRTPENLAKRIRLGDNFLQEITSRGKVLYEASNA